MPGYDYIAVDDAGQQHAGRIDAPNAEVAGSMLSAAGWTVRDLQPAALAAAVELQSGDFLPSTGSSLSLLTNLRALSEDLPNAKVRRAVHAMADRVERGESLPMAFSAVSDQLPPAMRTLLSLGLARGKLDILLAVYLDHARRLSDIRSALWLSLAYPVLLVGLVLSLSLALSIFIAPIFDRIYGDFGVELPALTAVILLGARLLRTSFLGLVLLIPLCLAAGWLVLRLAGGPGLPQWLFRKIPCIGSVFRWCSLANCCETLAMLVELETPLPDAFRTTATTSDDLLLADGLRIAADDVEQGRAAPGIVTALPRELAGAMRWAERPGLLINALRSSGEVFAARARVDLHLTRWLMEPVILFLVAVGIGIFVIALFMPLVKLLNDLS